MTQSPGWYPDPGGQGERWWDGERWGSHPRPQPAPTQRAQKPMRALGPNRSPVAVIAAIVLVVVIVVAIMISKSSSTDRDRAAKDVCHQTVGAQLKAPATAKYSGETVTHVGNDYRVEGAVDAENGFSALLRAHFSCSATFVSGNLWKPVTAELTPQ